MVKGFSECPPAPPSLVRVRIWDRETKTRIVKDVENRKSWMWAPWAEAYADRELRKVSVRDLAAIVQFTHREILRLESLSEAGVLAAAKMRTCMAIGLTRRGVARADLPDDLRSGVIKLEAWEKFHCDCWLCPRCENRHSKRREAVARDATRMIGAVAPRHISCVTLKMERRAGDSLAEQLLRLGEAWNRLWRATGGYFRRHAQAVVGFLDVNIPWGWQYEPIAERAHAFPLRAVNFETAAEDYLASPTFNAHFHCIAVGRGVRGLRGRELARQWSHALKDRAGKTDVKFPRNWGDVEAFKRYSAEHDYARVAAGLYDRDRDELLTCLQRAQLVRPRGCRPGAI